MINNYSWDLGFNFATAKSSSTGNYSLMMCFPGNNLFFNLFNLGPVGSYTYAFGNVTVTFSGTGENASPFTSTQSIPLGNNNSTQIQTSGNTATITIGSNVAQVKNGPSAIFVPGTSLQVWSIIPVVMMNLPGTFQVTVSITISRSDGVTGTFFHDPEMVVGSPPGPIDD